MDPNNELNKAPENDLHTDHDEATRIKYIGGHDYDGIKELDNPLPPWLKYLFYITIVFGAAYLILLWAFNDDRLKQEKEYQRKVQIAEAKLKGAEAQPSDSVAAATTKPVISIEAGKTTFQRLCSVCHGKNGEGLVGPNFTDEYWMHGGTLEEMTKVVVNGVIEKGMISYKNQLTSKQITEVLTYILTLQGTNPPNQKAPQGQKFERLAGK